MLKAQEVYGREVHDVRKKQKLKHTLKHKINKKFCYTFTLGSSLLSHSAVNKCMKMKVSKVFNPAHR